MKLRFVKLLAIALTSIIIASVIQIMSMVAHSENARNQLIQKHNLEEILQMIDESGVDNRVLSNAIAPGPSALKSYIFSFALCVIIVWIYHRMLSLINRRHSEGTHNILNIVCNNDRSIPPPH